MNLKGICAILCCVFALTFDISAPAQDTKKGEVPKAAPSNTQKANPLTESDVVKTFRAHKPENAGSSCSIRCSASDVGGVTCPVGSSCRCTCLGSSPSCYCAAF